MTKLNSDKSLSSNDILDNNPDRLMSSLKGVADGKAVTGDARGAKVGVVVDEVEARLGPNKEATLGIKLDASSEVGVEVVAGLVIGAGVDPAAGPGIEAGTQGADAADKFQICVAGKLGRVDGINVIKNWTIVEALASIVGLRRLPIDFASDTEIVEEEHVTAKAGIGATSERYGLVIDTVRLAGSRGVECADAESDVDFLRLREIREHRRCGADQGQKNSGAENVIQAKPPVSIGINRFGCSSKPPCCRAEQDLQDFTGIDNVPESNSCLGFH